jgi:hypothetical protein
MTIVEALQGLGITPTVAITPGSAEVALMQAGISLGFAKKLHTDLLQGDVSRFNASRPDGTAIVSGCSDAGWRATRDLSLAKALAYLERAAESGVVLPMFPAVGSLGDFFAAYDGAEFRASLARLNLAMAA